MRFLAVLFCSVILGGCGGGGNESVVSIPVPVVKAAIPSPVKKAATVTGANEIAIHTYQALHGQAPNNAMLIEFVNQIGASDGFAWAATMIEPFRAMSDSEFSSLVLKNLGITATSLTTSTIDTSVTGAIAYAAIQGALRDYFAWTGVQSRGTVVIQLSEIVSNLEGADVYGAAAIAFNAKAINDYGNIATYSVPVDISKITYPDSYQTPTTLVSDINTDPCNLNLNVVTYPQSWLGNYPLPKVVGAPLKSSMSRGMNLKDIMLHDNPAFILSGAPDVPDGCRGDLQAEFVKTVAKLKSLGVDYIYPPQWHWASINPDGTWYIMKAEDSFGPLSDADLTFLTNTAHAAGIKVVMLNQIQGMVNNSSSPAYQPASTLANFQKWFVAYQAYLNERSKFFQSIGVDIWEIGCGSCMFHDEGDGSPEAISLFSQEYAKAVINMKANYSGKTLMSTPSWLLEQTDFLKVIDVLGLGIWTQPFNEVQSASLTVELYKTAIDNGGWSSGISYWDQFGKTLMFWVGIQSRANALTLPGYLEETVCTAAIGDLNPSPTACAQRDTKTDFSLQAIVYEASFEKLNETNLKSNIIVVTGDYWETESLKPETAFPNLAMSPRNKPAEGILKMWFAR
ncbi:MAG: hypothetical protein WCI45_02190 [Desulfuromonadales bacterium]